MNNKKLIDAVKKELSKPATNTFHGIFKHGLKEDFEDGNFDTESMQKVKKKYKIK